MRTISIKGSGVRRLRGGGLWVYANEVADRLPGYEAGEVVEVQGPDGGLLGVGYVEPGSLIALRLLRKGAGPIDGEFVGKRVRAAEEARRRLVEGRVYRLLFSEADRLPGVIVDRYADVLTLQCTTHGADRLKGLVVESLRELYHPRAIVVLNEGEPRGELGLPTENEVLYSGGEIDLSHHRIELAGLELTVDFVAAQKTGLYLDQVANYRAVNTIDFTGLNGLDLFCYSGIFGMIALKRGAERVTFVDSSEPALNRLRENLDRNDIPPERYDIVRSDVVHYLAGCAPATTGFVFVDPPKYIKSRKGYYKGLQGYFTLNRAAIRALDDAGLLFTFSCSHHAGEEIFRKKVLDALVKENCTARELYRFRQNADHAVLLPMEESFYLKGLLLAIDRRKEESDDTVGISR